MGFTPSTLLLLGIKRFGPPLVAREAPRSAQRSIITSAYRGAQRSLRQNPPKTLAGQFQHAAQRDGLHSRGKSEKQPGDFLTLRWRRSRNIRRIVSDVADLDYLSSSGCTQT